jgi:P-loop Domain of unknown function (DUF2791)
MTPERKKALNIIHSLGESGQPPKLGASLLNVGTEPILKRLRQDYLEGLCVSSEGEDGSGTCRWVEGDYGNGKTQFLRCFQEQAWELDYVVAFVELHQSECPLDKAESVYGAVARSIQAKPLTPSDVDRSRGVDFALFQLFDRKFPGVLTGVGEDAALKTQATEWLNSTLANTPVEESALKRASVQFLSASLGGNEEMARLAGTYLRGEPTTAEHRKKIGIAEAIKKENGFRMLRSLCQLLQRSGLAAGTVLLFDEARRSLSLMSVRQQKVACENLLSVINHCNNGDFPGTAFLYAVMPEFFTDFATQYPALQQRCGASTRIRLNNLQGLSESELLRQIGHKVVEIYGIAHELKVEDAEVVDGNLRVLAGACIQRSMETGARRLMVKTCVQMLYDARENGFTALAPDGAERLMEGVREELRQVDSKRVSTEGE